MGFQIQLTPLSGFLWVLCALLLGVCMVLGALCRRYKRQACQAEQAAHGVAQTVLAADERALIAQHDKNKFLGMLSHELLTPLQSVVSSMDIIESKRTVSAADPVFMRLREGTLALQARTSDLVDFAKMSTGRLAVSTRKFRVDRLVEEVIADHEERLLEKDLGIYWEPQAALEQPLVTDPRRVRQILNNLVSNAIKYTERGGLTLEANFNVEQQLLTLVIRDTGIGISPEALLHIFDPFYRGPGAAKMAQGSGLGLAVVRSLVDLLQGTIEVDSQLGQGSSFVVRLPATATVAEVLAPIPSFGAAAPLYIPGPRGTTGTDVRVLIVDDAHDARTVLAQTVRGLGYLAHEAGSASEALRILASQAYALVLLDIELPDASGFKVIEQVRSQPGPNQRGYFVMMSASQHQHASVDLFNTRADKPVDLLRFKALLKSAG
jgi:signal transduction histidine kinase/CheY-like chemotaxis protein